MITNTTILHTIDVKYKDGKYGNFYEITMITEEGKVAVTYIDESFDNWWKWAYICKQPDNGYIITNCKHKTKYRTPQYTDEGYAIVDGDSLPDILLSCGIDEMRCEVAEMIANLAEQENDSPFDFE